MNPYLLRIIGTVYFFAMLFLGCLIHWYFTLAIMLILVISQLAYLSHRASCATYLSLRGLKLMWFGELDHFGTPSPSPYPWWVYFYDYDVIALDENQHEAKLFVLRVRGPFLAVVFPTILCKSFGDVIPVETDECEREGQIE